MNAHAWRSRILPRMGDGFTVRGKTGIELYRDKSIPDSAILQAAKQYRNGQPWQAFVRAFPDDPLPD